LLTRDEEDEVQTDFRTFFKDDDAYLLASFLLSLLETNGGAETGRTSPYDAHIDLIGGSLDGCCVQASTVEEPFKA